MRALLAAFASSAVLVLGCATASGTGGAGEPQAAGQRLYREHCGSCHRLRGPAEQTRQQWAEAVEKYAGRAHLSLEEKQLVLAYLEAEAKDAAPATKTESP
jgi:mono/diheme cytochrome c family protein